MLNYYLIGRRIEEVRKQRQLSQAELAERTDLSVSYISHIENAKKKASLKSLVLISDVLGVTVDALLTGNQSHCQSEYQNEIILLMENCSNYEKRIIFDQIFSLKKSLRANECLLPKQEE